MTNLTPQMLQPSNTSKRKFCIPVRGDSGSQIAEFALVLPLLFLVILAIFWFGLAFNVASTTERAAKQAAQAAAKPTCVSCTNEFPDNTAIVNTLNSVLRAGHLDPQNKMDYRPDFACTATPAPDCSTAENVEICNNAPLTCGTASCQSPPADCGANPTRGVRVSFRYNFKSPVPLGSWSAITIPASAQVNQEDDR
jgi:hypothetical protein